MPDEEEKQWYTNKDLFEKLTDLKGEVNGLRSEMYETRVIITSYNELRGHVDALAKQNDELRTIVNELVTGSQAKKTTFEDIRGWGGWLFGLITLFILIYKTFL